MRYFLTTNASRQYKAGNMFFSFELTHNVGATWRGVLAVADAAAASTLAAAGIPQIKEITAEEYEAQKKTLHQTSSSKSSESVHPPLPSLPPLGPVAVVESSTTARPVKTPEADPTLKPVELQTKHIEIVDDLALATSTPKHRAA